jgi:hypothetical protein
MCRPQCERCSAGGGKRRHSRYSVYLLYWYKSTHTDAARGGAATGTQFTSFTGTKVQILTLQDQAQQQEAAATSPAGTHFTCFYWYKSTHTDAEGRRVRQQTLAELRQTAASGKRGTRYSVLYWYKSTGTKVLALLVQEYKYLLYWYKSTNADAARGRGKGMRGGHLPRLLRQEVPTLLALLVPKYKSGQ